MTSHEKAYQIKTLLLSAWTSFLPNRAHSFADSYTVMPEGLWLWFDGARIPAPTLQSLSELSVSSNYRANRSPHCTTNTLVLRSNVGPTTSRCVTLTMILRTSVSFVKQRYKFPLRWAAVRMRCKRMHCSHPNAWPLARWSPSPFKQREG